VLKTSQQGNEAARQQGNKIPGRDGLQRAAVFKILDKIGI
jgi:hypothetical protein